MKKTELEEDTEMAFFIGTLMNGVWNHEVNIHEAEEQIEKLKGEMGITDSEIIRNIVMGWLMEKSFISTTLKSKLFKQTNAK